MDQNQPGSLSAVHPVSKKLTFQNACRGVLSLKKINLLIRMAFFI
jgi:hypothetical protein